MVFANRKKHRSVLQNNLSITNVCNLGCSLWSDDNLSLIREGLKSKKDKKYFILNDPNPIKGTPKAIGFCKEKGLNYNLVDKSSYSDFIKSLASHEGFVTFPTTLESFSRVVLEARMLGCRIATNKLNGCTHEPWFSQYKGEDLINFVGEKREEIVTTYMNTLFSPVSKGEDYGDITVILNCYRRPHNLKMQIDAIKSQSIKPKQIWLWINHHEDNIGFDASELGVDKIFTNDHNWKFYGRFAAALLVDTEYIAIYDDDTVPGRLWHKNCLDTMETHEGILGSAGIILNGNRYIQHDRCGWPTQNAEITEVDLVGHAWFFKREWLRYLWQEKPATWDNGEDIQFSFMCQIHGGIKTFCPPHPRNNKELHGSILGNELGIDDKATSTNGSVSHHEFFSQRDACVHAGLDRGWETVKGIKK